MLPRSKATLAFLLALPILLFIPLWQTAQKRPHLWGVLASPVASLTLSHDGSVVAFKESGGLFGIWPRGGQRQSLQNEGVGMTNTSPPELRFAFDDRTLLASNIPVSSSSTALYSWDTGTRQIKWSALSAAPNDLCKYWPSLDGKRAVQRSYDVVKVLDISGAGVEQDSKKSGFARAFPVLTRFRTGIANPKRGHSMLQTASLSADGKTFVGAFSNGQLEFWNVATGQIQSKTPTANIGSGSTNWELECSPDGRFVALFNGASLCVWDIVASKWSTSNVNAGSSEVDLAWMPDSRSVWTGAGSVQQWSVPTLKSLRDLPVSGPVAVSGDGRTLVTRALGVNGYSSGIWAWDIG